MASEYCKRRFVLLYFVLLKHNSPHISLIGQSPFFQVPTKLQVFNLHLETLAIEVEKADRIARIAILIGLGFCQDNS